MSQPYFPQNFGDAWDILIVSHANLHWPVHETSGVQWSNQRGFSNLFWPFPAILPAAESAKWSPSQNVDHHLLVQDITWKITYTSDVEVCRPAEFWRDRLLRSDGYRAGQGLWRSSHELDQGIQ